MHKSRILSFHRNGADEWFLHLPEWKGDPQDLQMVDGADQWLEILGGHRPDVKIELSDRAFEHSDVLVLQRLKEKNFGGGGIYLLETYRDRNVNLQIWLCEVTRTVFGHIPKRIYFLVKDK